ncbi:hypothetical protein J6590_083818 [Homalodisca vitripennis]|nr:hypothetical protein J6590_083818 [Homalodisca vitripennis]
MHLIEQDDEYQPIAMMEEAILDEVESTNLDRGMTWSDNIDSVYSKSASEKRWPSRLRHWSFDLSYTALPLTVVIFSVPSILYAILYVQFEDFSCARDLECVAIVGRGGGVALCAASRKHFLRVMGKTLISGILLTQITHHTH